MSKFMKGDLIAIADDRTIKVLKIKIYEAEEGGYWTEVPVIPGCVTEGDTLEELEDNLHDAIQGCLEVLEEQKY